MLSVAHRPAHLEDSQMYGKMTCRVDPPSFGINYDSISFRQLSCYIVFRTILTLDFFVVQRVVGKVCWGGLRSPGRPAVRFLWGTAAGILPKQISLTILQPKKQFCRLYLGEQILSKSFPLITKDLLSILRNVMKEIPDERTARHR